MKSLDNIAEDLFNKIRGRFPSVTIGDQDGKITNDPLVARFFDFDYKEGDRNVGKVSISISEEKLSIMYSNSFVENEDTVTRQNWYDFLKELRVFARKRLLQFDTRDITKSNLDKRDYKFLAQQQGGETTMSESKMYGTSKQSYQNIGNARLSIKHTETVNQEIAAGRTQKIGAIYVENADGERFKYPYKHLNGARAMARHVAEGGKPYDDFGKHITSLSEELANLRKFKTYMNRSSVMAESLAEYADVIAERLNTIKKTVASLQKETYYKEAVSSYELPVMEDVPSDVAENWIEQLTIKQFNEDLKDVFPYVYKLVSEATRATELGPDDLLGEEEKGAIKDTYLNKKTKEEIELESAFESALGQFSDEICEDCGNQSWTTLGMTEEEIEEGERHGNSAIYKKCWKGYSRVPGTTAGEPGSCEKNEGNAYANAVRQAKKDGKEKGDKVDGPDGDEIVLASKEQKTPLGEFILSYYDRENGTFPKGETAILTMIEKDYGEEYIDPAKSFIEAINTKFEQINGYKDPELVEDDDDLYTVQKGDTVYSLSKQSGTPVGDIIEINGLDDSAAIQVGQQLRVPGINQIGASPATPGATRGIDPKDNYSKDDFERLVNQGTTEEFNDIKKLAGL